MTPADREAWNDHQRANRRAREHYATTAHCPGCGTPTAPWPQWPMRAQRCEECKTKTTTKENT